MLLDQPVTTILLAGTAHDIAEILKACAAEIQTRQLPGYQLIYDVAFEIHAVTSHAVIEAHVRKALDRPPLRGNPSSVLPRIVESGPGDVPPSS